MLRTHYEIRLSVYCRRMWYKSVQKQVVYGHPNEDLPAGNAHAMGMKKNAKHTSIRHKSGRAFVRTYRAKHAINMAF